MAENKEIILERVNNEINKIANKESNLFFFVIDTKGNPSGSLEYIYNLALIAQEGGYNVTMVYQEEEFVGVGDWLGEEYVNLKHQDISKGETQVGPSDVLFIPELFSNVMIQTKKFPCKRVVILQNYNYVLEQSTVAAQWGDYGIFDVITNTEENERLIKDVFPYLRTTVIKPYLSDNFCKTINPKDLVVNIVAKEQTDINKIIKPFYWKYFQYKWVSFKDLRGLSKEEFARSLRTSPITIWVDEDTNFGYSALEAMKSGAIVIAKVPTENIEWAITEDGRLTNACVWFNSFHDVQRILASVVRGVVTEKVPEEIEKAQDEIVNQYTKDNTATAFNEFLTNTLNERKKELEAIIEQVNLDNNKENE